MAKEKNFRDGKKHRPKKTKKARQKKRKQKAKSFWEARWLAWHRARNSGARTEDLRESEVVLEQGDCFLVETNLDADINKITERSTRERRSEIIGKVGHLIP